MKLDKFMLYCDKHDIFGTLIIKLKSKYSFEDKYDIDNEVVNIDPAGDFIWLNDWDEGQDEVYVLGYIRVDDIEIKENLL